MNLLALTLAALLSASPAGLARAKRLFHEGSVAYEAGRYGKALKEFRSAYAAAPRPGFLFNIAQCERQLSRFPAAARDYRLYLAAETDPRRRAVAERYLSEVEARLGSSARPEEPRTARTEPVREEPVPVPMNTPVPIPVTSASPPPAGAPAGTGEARQLALTPPAPREALTGKAPPRGMPPGAKWLGVAGLSSAVLGGAALGIGVALAGPDLGSPRVLSNSTGQDGAANTLGYAGQVLLGVGIGALIGAGIWALVGS